MTRTTETTETTAVTAAETTVGSPEDSQLPPRRTAVIGNETTIEIPVHLLFREDSPDVLAPAASREGGAAGHAADAPAGVPVTAPLRGAAGARTGGSAARTTQQPRKAVRVGLSDRQSPTTDPRTVERTGVSLPGAAALLVGAAALAGLATLLWRAGLIPDPLAAVLGLRSYPFEEIGPATEVAATGLAMVAVFVFLGLGRGRTGHAWVLSCFGDYRGTVRRTGLVWTNPLLLRRPVDVRLRHWRSEPMPVTDADGTALRVVLLVVWRVTDTAKASHAVACHEKYLGEQVEAAAVRVLSRLPADAFHGDAPTLRDAEAVGDALTRVLRAEAAPVGVEVYSAQPARIDYAPEVADAMRRRRDAAFGARNRDRVLTSVLDAVDETVARLTSRGLVDLDTADRNALVKDLTIAFCAGRV